jgi:hypothetical protein
MVSDQAHTKRVVIKPKDRGRTGVVVAVLLEVGYRRRRTSMGSRRPWSTCRCKGRALSVVMGTDFAGASNLARNIRESRFGALSSSPDP